MFVVDCGFGDRTFGCGARGSRIRMRNHQDVIAVLLDGSVAQLGRQGLIGLIPIKRIVSDQDLVDARQLHAFEPDAGVPVGVVRDIVLAT